MGPIGDGDQSQVEAEHLRYRARWLRRKGSDPVRLLCGNDSVQGGGLHKRFSERRSVEVNQYIVQGQRCGPARDPGIGDPGRGRKTGRIFPAGQRLPLGEDPGDLHY